MAVFLVSVLFLAFLAACTLLVLKKAKLASRQVLFLFLFALFLHLVAALLIFYAQFYPFGGGKGDATIFHNIAIEVSQDFKQGDFSLVAIKAHLEPTGVSHWYPVALGAIYALTLPAELVGIMLSVWFSVLAALLVYFIAKELGAKDFPAALAGVAATLYPSLLYFGSMLLRESFVAILVLLALLISLRLIKSFSWQTFFVLYGVLALLTHLRFYMGFAAILAFFLSWLCFLQEDWKKKLKHALMIIFLLGFLPQFSGRGYYGFSDVPYFLRFETIRTYRESAYLVHPIPNEILETLPQEERQQLEEKKGPGSTAIVNLESDDPPNFVLNSLYALLTVFLGPFSWNFQYARHWFTLVETIPWYILFFFIVRGLLEDFRQKKAALPIVFWAVVMLGVISLFMASNFGVYMRIRMPVFLMLFAVLPFGLERLNRRLFGYGEQKN